MKSVILLLSTLSVTAFAHDSTWKLCEGKTPLFGENEPVLVNLYEHRTSHGRAIDLTLIFGGNLLSGSLNSTTAEAGPVKLTQKTSVFVGSAAVDFAADTLALKGTLSLAGGKTPVDAVLNCRTIRD